ncbi:MAG: hypothetical protein AAFR46_06775 [Pseudomonadota bacterium]
MTRAGWVSGLLALALTVPVPVLAQEACPWGGAVRRVQDFDGEVFFGTFASDSLFGRIENMPQCDTTLEQVRAAVKRPACGLYADRPDALGIEIVLTCLMAETDDQPENGTIIYFNERGAELLAPEVAQ